MQHHKYSLTELDNMMPWEREIYVGLVVEHVEEENRKMEEQQKLSNTEGLGSGRGRAWKRKDHLFYCQRLEILS